MAWWKLAFVALVVVLFVLLPFGLESIRGAQGSILKDLEDGALVDRGESSSADWAYQVLDWLKGQ